MSLFIGIPIDTYLAESVIDKAKSRLRNPSAVTWFGNRLHLTLAYLDTASKTEEDELVETFVQKGLLNRIAKYSTSLILSFDHLERFGNGDILAMTGQPNCPKLKTLTTNSRRILGGLAGREITSRYKVFRPHVSLGEIKVTRVSASASVFDLLNPINGFGLLLPIDRIALFQRPFGKRGRRNYKIIVERQLKDRTQKAP